MQGIILLVILISGDQIESATIWLKPGTGYAIGGFIAQFLGNALHEETIFRGFLIGQLWVAFNAKSRGSVKPLVLALVVSQVLFALCHIPNRIFVKDVYGGELIGDQLMLFVYGLIFASLFLVTDNLFVAVGIHALWNDPLPLLEIDESASALIRILLTLVLLLAWWARKRKRLRGVWGSPGMVDSG